MNPFFEFMHFLHGEMERPTMYGWYHLLCLGILFLGTFLICYFAKDSSQKRFRLILGISWGVFLVFELYKQLVMSFEYDGANSYFEYNWYYLPFQFCSTPFYILPFLAFFPNKGKVSSFVYDSFLAFAGSFMFFAGIGVMFYPATVFVGKIGINIQTMVHHGMMVLLGAFIAVHERKKFDLHLIWKGIFPFLALCVIAITLNESLYGRVDGNVNMFFLSPHYACELPVLSSFQGKVPYPVFLLLYVVGFSAVGFAAFGVLYGANRLILHFEKNKEA